MDYGHLNSKFLESRGIPKVEPIDYFNELCRKGREAGKEAAKEI